MQKITIWSRECRKAWIPLKRQIEEADREKKELGGQAGADFEIEEEDKRAYQASGSRSSVLILGKHLSGDTGTGGWGRRRKKREAFDAFREKVHRQDGIYEENKIHLQDQCKEREKEIGALQEKIRRLESNILVFPAEVENARNKIQRG